MPPSAGKPVLRWAAEALAPHVALLQPVGDPAPLAAALAGLAHLPPVPGGAERQDSVRAGLEALAPHAPDLVLVHDAARPCIPAGTVPALVAALADLHGAIPAVPVGDTLKRVRDGMIGETVPRDGLFRAQTPQAFRFATLLDLHRQAGARRHRRRRPAGARGPAGRPGARRGGQHQADLSGGPGAPGTPAAARHWSRASARASTCTCWRPGGRWCCAASRCRMNAGWPATATPTWACTRLCDAIYGALAEGDIGRHFPPTEATWKDADSARFLVHAAGRIAARGGRLANADVTLICERPKIAPHAAAMEARITELMGVGPGLVSVKATTTERLGFAGRGEGIAAQAVATVLLPG